MFWCLRLTNGVMMICSPNNTIRHAKDAIKKQGVDEVWFEFTNKNIEIIKQIRRLNTLGIHGKYYFKDDITLYDF